MNAIARACQAMADDFQTSDGHHPDHVLVSKVAFEQMVAALSEATTAGSVGTQKPSGFGVDHEAKSEAALWKAHDELALRYGVDHENHEALREKVARLDAALARLLPVVIHETPDYAEVTFGEAKVQAMTLEPDTLLALNELPAILAALQSGGEGG